MERILVTTTAREQMVNVTRPVQDLVTDKGWNDGFLLLYCPHTSGAVTINEAADPAVLRDFMNNLERLLPRDADYLHMDNSHAHIKSSAIGPNVWVIVENGQLQFGSWQGLFFCEFDGPRSREVWVKWMGSGLIKRV